VEVAPGDLIVGDVDGIVAIPRALAADVAEAIATKHRLEENARWATLTCSTAAAFPHGVVIVVFMRDNVVAHV
jgi:regulator of RNase E activity RraA